MTRRDTGQLNSLHDHSYDYNPYDTEDVKTALL